MAAIALLTRCGQAVHTEPNDAEYHTEHYASAYQTQEPYAVLEAEPPQSLQMQIKNGDFSRVRVPEYDENLPEALKRLHENAERFDYEWIEFDLNGDGTSQLILQAESYNAAINRIVAIFDFDSEAQETEVIYLHTAGLSNFIFMGRNGNLVMFSSSSSIYIRYNFTRIMFDNEWNMVRLHTLSVTYIYDFAEMPGDWLERNPGMGDEGIFFTTITGNNEEPHESQEIGKTEFIEYFFEMTGFPFHLVEPDWFHTYYLPFPVSIRTVRLNENMPEFTVILRARDYIFDYNEPQYHSFPSPREVCITVKDDRGDIIQYIPGLTISGHFIPTHPSFSDYNFDGYLDMGLTRWQDGAGGLLAQEYFWLWDSEASQFVMNEQLMEISHAASFYADQEHRQIVVFQRAFGSRGHQRFLYEYHNDEFVLVEESSATWVNSPYFLRPPVFRDSYNQPDFQIQIMIQSAELFEIGYHEVDITIWHWDEDIILLQHITGVTIDKALIDLPNIVNFADYTGNGYFDFSIGRSHGGSMGNEPRYFWLWCVVSQQFVLNETLTELSNFASISIEPDGNLRAFHRDGQRHMWLTFAFKDDDFVLILSEEWEALHDNGAATGYATVTVIDRISGIETVTIEPLTANALEKPAQTAPKNALVHCDFLACFAVLKCVRYT